MNGKNNKPIATQTVNGKQKPDLSESSLLSADRAGRAGKIGANGTSTANLTTKSKRSNNTKGNAMGVGVGQKTAVSADNGKQAKLIKKAYVRFDDYLDLNEENMRRSCKRLMNHLYSEPSPVTGAAMPNVAPEISAARAQPIKCQPGLVTGASNKLIGPSPANKNESAAQQRRQSLLPRSTASAQEVAPASVLEAATATPAATSGKSYLRSQYERRQLRQLELMQQETAVASANTGKNSAGGANARRQQQDLMAKSHELSKRRFFEKLERRESIKNLSLSTTGKQQQLMQQQQSQQHQPDQKAPIQITTTDEDPPEADKQKNLFDDQLMLKMYQSIVLGDGSELSKAEEQTNKDTLQRSGGTHAKEQVGELIEFHTESPQSKPDEPERLIELSGEHEECPSSGVAAASTLDQSAFEIKVPAPSSNSLIHGEAPDGFAGSNLLVVKQVEDATLTGQFEVKLAGLVEAGANRPPTSIGRHKEGATYAHQKESNKTKKPLVDSTDNKVNSPLAAASAAEQINGQGRSNEIMEEAAIAEVKVQHSTEAMAAPSMPTIIGSDNQCAADGVSSAISSGNSSNKMETVASAEETTDNVGSGESAAGTMEESASCKKQPPVEVGGDLNRAKDHEAPETAMLVEQSGGAVKDATASSIVNLDSVLVPDKQSTAQAQQEANLQTTITNLVIRDVLPEANGGSLPMEAIVSGENEFEKVKGASKQVNEVQLQQTLPQQEGFQCDIYANPVACNEMQKNNVNHDELMEARLSSGLEAMSLMSENERLIESSFEKHPELVKKHSTCSTAEEDGGSSCSSSGFGASVSVTSSSDGFNSTKGAGIIVAGLKRDGADFRRPSSLALIARNEQQQQYDRNPIYDSVRLPRNLPRIQTTATEFLDRKQIVGPGQAYPESRALVIENHNYASVVNRCNSSQLELEKDNLNERYANLPKSKPQPPVEYATVRSSASGASKKFNNSLSEASISGQSFSTSSVKSGGFSALPPARIDCSPANNLEEGLFSLSIESSQQQQQQQKSSILKRFGSLVSKAFTATNASPPVTSKINESPVDRKQPENDQTGPDEETKPTMVIAKEHEVAGGVQVDKADLVILPTKQVNQRKLLQQEKNSPLRRHDDDRLSRAKKHSRRMKQTDSSSVTSESSSFSSLSSTSRRKRNDGEHLKKADSLSEELGSLMSRSKHSNHYRKKSTKSFSRRAVSSSRRAEPITAIGRIDIDCVSPTKAADKGAHYDRQSASGPRSLLRLFGSAAPTTPQRAAESTPNLVNSLHQSRHLSLCDNQAECQDDDSLQPISGFWGFTSLIGSGHATADGRKTSRASRGKVNVEKDLEERDSLLYSSLKPLAAGYKLHRSSANSLEQQQQLDKYQSLNLYQNLLRNYNKRRQRCHGHHHHHHHHHNRLHHNLTNRHAYASAKYTQGCSQTCHSSSNSESSSCASKTTVWGQLIKINKSDGSQVIELQRCPGKSWGFFVARGAINNMKGIFISRMHDKVTSDSLTGLLSIGDRILAIDECPIEPDYDILRVNQMISKKSKILLKVKPYKG